MVQTLITAEESHAIEEGKSERKALYSRQKRNSKNFAGNKYIYRNAEQLILFICEKDSFSDTGKLFH